MCEWKSGQDIADGKLTFAIAFFTLPAGPLADRWSRRKVVSLGGLSYGVGMIICAFSDRLAVFILGRVIAGAGQGFFFSTAGLWQVETAPKKVGPSGEMRLKSDSREDRGDESAVLPSEYSTNPELKVDWTCGRILCLLWHNQA